MVNNFSVEKVDLYINWGNTFLFIISNFESTDKKPPFTKVAIFSDIVLVSNYHGCTGETLYLIPHYLIDTIHTTVKQSHLEKLQIIQNINKLMFLLIFIFSVEF